MNKEEVEKEWGRMGYLAYSFPLSFGKLDSGTWVLRVRPNFNVVRKTFFQFKELT